MLLVPSTATNMAEWVRKVATAINWLLGRQGLPFGEPSTTAPTNPQIGQAWVDSSDANTAKIWDGSAWQSLW